jgi:hypothetical protein
MKTVLVLILAQLATTSALAAKSRFDTSLSRLDPVTRLEQVCDLHAMNSIDKDRNPFHPDRAKTDAVTHPHIRGDIVSGTGGAFRSGGKWYQFSFTCKGSPDHMRVLSFTYKLGREIPESKWADYGLWR